jgi:hypothetical protein
MSPVRINMGKRFQVTQPKQCERAETKMQEDSRAAFCVPSRSAHEFINEGVENVLESRIQGCRRLAL